MTGTLARPTTTRNGEDRADTVQKLLDLVMDRYLAYVGLAIGVAFTPFLDPDAGAGFWLLVGGLVAVTVAWCLAFVTLPPTWARQPVAGTAYMAGYLALMMPLVVASPLFAFMALSAYGQAFTYLRGRWRFVAVCVTAVPVAYAQTGGRFAERTPATWIAFGVLIVVNAVVAGLFTYWGVSQSEQSSQRGRVIAELEEANRRLSVALEENAGLHVQLLAQAREAGVLDERQRMAREIHDTIAQGLTGIVRQLEAADAAEEQPRERRRHIDTARALARENLAEARRSVQALAPGPLDEAHLPDAIADLAKRWADTNKVTANAETTGEPRPLLADLEVTLFRVAQEALANVARHAAATRVGITLSYTDVLVVLDVRDDGVGFRPDAAPTSDAALAGGFGLRAMRQRVQRAGGTLEVESAPGEGTAVSASVPAIGPEQPA